MSSSSCWRSSSSLGVVDVVGQRLADLDVGGEHRVGRGEDGAQQQRDGGREPGHPPPDDGDAQDGERHRHEQQPPHRRPGAPGAPPARSRGRSMARPTPISATSTVNSVTCVIARWSWSRLAWEGGVGGGGSRPARVVLRLHADVAGERQESQRHAHPDQHHRRRQRDAAGGLRQDDREQQGQAEEEVDRGCGLDVRHVPTLAARIGCCRAATTRMGAAAPARCGSDPDDERRATPRLPTAVLLVAAACCSSSGRSCSGSRVEPARLGGSGSSRTSSWCVAAVALLAAMVLVRGSRARPAGVAGAGLHAVGQALTLAVLGLDLGSAAASTSPGARHVGLPRGRRAVVLLLELRRRGQRGRRRPGAHRPGRRRPSRGSCVAAAVVLGFGRSRATWCRAGAGGRLARCRDGRAYAVAGSVSWQRAALAVVVLAWTVQLVRTALASQRSSGRRCRRTSPGSRRSPARRPSTRPAMVSGLSRWTNSRSCSAV